MANFSILLFTFSIYVTVHSVNAHREGEYTTNLAIILEAMYDDPTIWGDDTKKDLTGVSLTGDSFVDICNDSTPDEKLSICVKVVEHKWQRKNPTAFIVSPEQTDWDCRITALTGAVGVFNFYQRMYVCPSITVRVDGNEDIEPSFLIAQGLHETQYRVRAFKPGNPSHVEGQLTGLSLTKLNFTTDEGNRVYTPNNDSGSGIYSFRSRGNLNDYVLKYKEKSAGSSWFGKR